MRDESRPPDSHASEPSPANPPARAQRHPALRPRLGDIAEEEMSAFSVRPQEPVPAEAQAPQEPQAAQAPRTGKNSGKASGKAGRPSKVAGAPSVSSGKMERRRGSAGGGLKKFALLVVLPCALAGGAGWAMTTPRLAIAGVDVEGIEATPENRVQPIWEALRGQNWLRADLVAARSRLAKLPTIQAASVSRVWNHWPPRLSVRIQERRPWLRLGGGGSWWIVDRSGVAFRRATRQDRALYAITSTEFDAESLRVGQKVPPKIWDGVRRLALAMDESSKGPETWQIRRAYLDRDNHASLRLRGGSQDGLLVRLGDGLWPQKMERAQRALLFFQAAGRRAQSLNLVSFSMPTWTPLQPRPATPKAASATPGGASNSGEVPANGASNAASTTPTDIPNTAPENAAQPFASTSSKASTSDDSGDSDGSARPGPAEKEAADGAQERGEPDGAEESA